MKNTNSYVSRIVAFVGSNPFFWGVVGLLVLQAAWIALTGRYPMAFDEDFHLGLIKLYAHHPNPFWDGQAAGGDAFGAVARDPSYLYHYLMSFPYRFISMFTDSLHVQVVLLRFMNIAFLASGLIIYRRLLLKSGITKQIAHLTLLILVLLPVTSLLAAQINYDNVFIPLVGVVLLLTLRLNGNSTKKSLDVSTLLLLLLVSLSTAIVKYAFLPIFLGIVGYSGVVLWKKYASVGSLKKALAAGWTQSSKLTLITLILAITIAGSLFIERYGVNLIRYHKPVADCAEVLNYEHCQYYGPWIRDYNFKMQKAPSSNNPIAYSYDWVYGMWFRTFFAVDGPSTGFQTRGPLTIPGIGGFVFGAAGLIAFAISAKKIWRRYQKSVLWLMSVVSLGYLAALWLEEYRLFLETGRPVAINGRYLLPILPFLIMFGILGIQELTARRPRLQLSIASLAILCLIWGGGAVTYILRSNAAWYWQGNQAVKSANQSVQKTFGPITPGYNQPTQFLP